MRSGLQRLRGMGDGRRKSEAGMTCPRCLYQWKVEKLMSDYHC